MVYTSTSPLGPFAYQGDVGSNGTHPFDPASPYNYVTRAQGTKVWPVEAADGTTQHVWLGNQWVTAANGARNQDLLYWSVLEFDVDGRLLPVTRSDVTQLSVP